MNQTLTDNNISALIDTNDGAAYLKHFRKYLGDVPARVSADYNRNIERGAELHATSTTVATTQLIDEAFMILASFAEIGRSADNAAGDEEVLSEERSRINAMLMAAITFAFGYNMRICKEQFADAVKKYGREEDKSSDRMVFALLLYLTENKHRISTDARIIHEMIGVMSKRIYDECVEGLRHDVD